MRGRARAWFLPDEPLRDHAQSMTERGELEDPAYARGFTVLDAALHIPAVHPHVVIPDAIGKVAARLFTRVVEFVWLPELTVERNALKNDLLAEQVRKERLENLRRALELKEVVDDPEARRRIEAIALTALAPPLDPIFESIDQRKTRSRLKEIDITDINE